MPRPDLSLSQKQERAFTEQVRVDRLRDHAPVGGDQTVKGQAVYNIVAQADIRPHIGEQRAVIVPGLEGAVAAVRRKVGVFRLRRFRGIVGRQLGPVCVDRGDLLRDGFQRACAAGSQLT